MGEYLTLGSGVLIEVKTDDAKIAKRKLIILLCTYNCTVYAENGQFLDFKHFGHIWTTFLVALESYITSPY